MFIIVHPMRVLALDTTTAAASVALAEGTRLLEVAAIDPSRPVATRLPGDLAALLERHGLALPSIDLFAVATGPGSFTGLRIGIATMQGLAFAEERPLVGVSAFEALASCVAAPRVGVWIDAWRGEVYAATLANDPEPRLEGEPMVAPPAMVLAERGTAAPPIYIGDGALRYKQILPRVVEPTPLLAGAIARLAHTRADAGEQPPPHAIRPLYVRRPDAELARDRR
jgi:tRNA threonylcarbamoyladenosine biosynthesis protein TsaB